MLLDDTESDSTVALLSHLLSASGPLGVQRLAIASGLHEDIGDEGFSLTADAETITIFNEEAQGGKGRPDLRLLKVHSNLSGELGVEHQCQKSIQLVRSRVGATTASDFSVPDLDSNKPALFHGIAFRSTFDDKLDGDGVQVDDLFSASTANVLGALLAFLSWNLDKQATDMDTFAVAFALFKNGEDIFDLHSVALPKRGTENGSEVDATPEAIVTCAFCNTGNTVTPMSPFDSAKGPFDILHCPGCATKDPDRRVRNYAVVPNKDVAQRMQEHGCAAMPVLHFYAAPKFGRTEQDCFPFLNEHNAVDPVPFPCRTNFGTFQPTAASRNHVKMVKAGRCRPSTKDVWISSSAPKVSDSFRKLIAHYMRLAGMCLNYGLVTAKCYYASDETGRKRFFTTLKIKHRANCTPMLDPRLPSSWSGDSAYRDDEEVCAEMQVEFSAEALKDGLNTPLADSTSGTERIRFDTAEPEPHATEYVYTYTSYFFGRSGQKQANQLRWIHRLSLDDKSDKCDDVYLCEKCEDGKIVGMKATTTKNVICLFLNTPLTGSVPFGSVQLDGGVYSFQWKRPPGDVPPLGSSVQSATQHDEHYVSGETLADAVGNASAADLQIMFADMNPLPTANEIAKEPTATTRILDGRDLQSDDLELLFMPDDSRRLAPPS